MRQTERRQIKRNSETERERETKRKIETERKIDRPNITDKIIKRGGEVTVRVEETHI